MVVAAKRKLSATTTAEGMMDMAIPEGRGNGLLGWKKSGHFVMSLKANNPRLPSLPSPKSPCFSLLLAIATVVAATFAATVTPYTHHWVKHMFHRNNSIRYILSRRPCTSICTLAKILIINSSLIGYWSFCFFAYKWTRRS